MNKPKNTEDIINPIIGVYRAPNTFKSQPLAIISSIALWIIHAGITSKILLKAKPPITWLTLLSTVIKPNKYNKATVADIIIIPIINPVIYFKMKLFLSNPKEENFRFSTNLTHKNKEYNT